MNGQTLYKLTVKHFLAGTPQGAQAWAGVNCNIVVGTSRAWTSTSTTSVSCDQHSAALRWLALPF